MWSKLGDYVQTAIKLVVGLVGKLSGLVGSISEVGEFVAKIVAAVTTLNSVSPKLNEFAAKLDKYAPSIGIVWRHGEGELKDTAKGIRALTGVFAALETAANEPTEANLKAVQAAIDNPDLEQLKISL